MSIWKYIYIAHELLKTIWRILLYRTDYYRSIVENLYTVGIERRIYKNILLNENKILKKLIFYKVKAENLLLNWQFTVHATVTFESIFFIVVRVGSSPCSHWLVRCTVRSPLISAIWLWWCRSRVITRHGETLQLHSPRGLKMTKGT